jgi:hypothetical protein
LLSTSERLDKEVDEEDEYDVGPTRPAATRYLRPRRRKRRARVGTGLEGAAQAISAATSLGSGADSAMAERILEYVAAA